MRLFLIFLAGCAATPSPSGPANTGGSTVAARLPSDAELGWLAVVPQAMTAPASWIPAATYTAIVPGNGPLRGGRLFDTAGGATMVEPVGPTDVRYGCDNNSLAVTILATTDKVTLAPGVAWLPPPAITAKALALRPAVSTPSKRHYATGPLTIDLARTGDETGRFAIAWRGHSIHDEAFERVRMAGADSAPIRLDAANEVAVPEPIAAWSFADDQAALVVVRTQGYEGSTLEAIVVGERGARKVASMTTYLYYCAF